MLRDMSVPCLLLHVPIASAAVLCIPPSDRQSIAVAATPALLPCTVMPSKMWLLTTQANAKVSSAQLCSYSSMAHKCKPRRAPVRAHAQLQDSCKLLLLMLCEKLRIQQQLIVCHGLTSLLLVKLGVLRTCICTSST